MNDLPTSVRKYAETPVFDEGTTPDKLRGEHSTKPGVWGRITVLAGRLDYVIPGSPEQRQALEPATPGIIRPAEIHFVRPLGPVRFRVEFLR